jgi:protein SCO1/2
VSDPSVLFGPEFVKEITMQKLSFRMLVALSAIAAACLLSVGSTSAATWHGDYFPNVPLTTQDGKIVHFYDDLLKNKKVVINFIYTSCGAACPLETARLAQVSRILGDHMGRDIFFYSFSIDPEHDTPPELKSYAEKFHVGPGWLFLTGKKEDIELIRAKLGQAARPDENQLTDHSTRLMIGNEATGQWMPDGSMDNPQYIAAIIRDWMAGSEVRNKPGRGYAHAPALPEYVADKGGYLFHNQCVACHTLGGGDGVGPDLRGITRVRDHDWLMRFIAKPDKMLASNDLIATALFNKYKHVRMPSISLTDLDVAALIHYLEKESALPNDPEKPGGSR